MQSIWIAIIEAQCIDLPRGAMDAISEIAGAELNSALQCSGVITNICQR